MVHCNNNMLRTIHVMLCLETSRWLGLDMQYCGLHAERAVWEVVPSKQQQHKVRAAAAGWPLVRRHPAGAVTLYATQRELMEHKGAWDHVVRCVCND